MGAKRRDVRYRDFQPGASARLFTWVMMPITRFAASAFALVCLAGTASAQNTVTSEPPATFTLRNGLQVLVIQDHRTPVVTQMVWYKVGSADETPGKSGLAHFLEHLMFKGNKAEVAPFKGEPDRETLTMPPPGYQTPSPNFAYGTGPKESLNKEYNPSQGKYGE